MVNMAVADRQILVYKQFDVLIIRVLNAAVGLTTSVRNRTLVYHRANWDMETWTRGGKKQNMFHDTQLTVCAVTLLFDFVLVVIL
jgi:hypothetical protein